MNAITIAFIIGVISIICIGIWLMKGTIDFIAERNEQYRKEQWQKRHGYKNIK